MMTAANYFSLMLSLDFNRNNRNWCNQEIIESKEDDQVRKTKINLQKEHGMKMVCGKLYIAKENSEKPEGEDAHFICMEKQTVGVADGVGGWAKYGIDGGEYARELMNNSFIAARNYNKNKNNVDDELKRKRKGPFDKHLIGAVDPRKVLEEAHAKNKEKIGLQGSSTACILSLDKERGVLHAVNVGDSGFMLFRDNKLLYQSPIQQRRFNFTYQLGNGINSDSPDSAWEKKDIHTVPGDIIVLGTDGLLDNMFPSEIEEVLVANSTSNSKDREGGGGGDRDFDCDALASRIANLALYNSFDKHNPSPFSENARKAGFEYVGGKIDDITVIVARVVAM